MQKQSSFFNRLMGVVRSHNKSSSSINQDEMEGSSKKGSIRSSFRVTTFKIIKSNIKIYNNFLKF